MTRWSVSVLGLLLGAFQVQADSLMSLDQALREHDTQVQRASQSVLVSEARSDQARAQLGPQVQLSASANQTERRQLGLNQRFLGEDYGITLSQPIFDRPRALESDRIEALTERAVAGESRILQERRLELLQAFAEWVEALEHQRLLEERSQNLTQRRTQVARLFERQRVSITELLTVENELERVQVELVSTQATQARAESSILNLTGLDVNLDWLPRPATESWSFADLQSNASDDMTHPALREARATLEAALLALRQADGRSLPTLSAQLGVRHTNIGANDTETAPVDTYTARLTLSWLLYDSGDRDARVREADLLVRDAELGLMEVERELQRQSATLDAELKRAEAAWRAAKAERDSARKLVEAANRSFDVGVGDLGDSLVALDRLIDAEMRVSSTWLSGLLAAAQIAENREQLNEATMRTLSNLVAP